MSQMYLHDPQDVIVQFKGDAYSASVGPILRASGWRGGQWVQYVDPGNLVDDFVIEASSGEGSAGFLIFPSEGYGADAVWGAVNNYTGMQQRPDAGGNTTVTFMSGGGRYLFRVFETVALDVGGARAGGPAVYTWNQPLKISERGFLCNDSDANLNAAGVVAPKVVGICSMVPSIRNNQRLGLDMKL